ncbi:hypothetical protein DPMN_135690 [Dreissena polymorpha]|uniref:Uncharacterized protein n=1 Tax=Dreissena polymorpha TaxID=45954 RepID=A0A9D4JH40_DREPO|nr:hypothetical protein DPMN_135690 [Dreissena polymorpha]
MLVVVVVLVLVVVMVVVVIVATISAVISNAPSKHKPWHPKPEYPEGNPPVLYNDNYQAHVRWERELNPDRLEALFSVTFRYRHNGREEVEGSSYLLTFLCGSQTLELYAKVDLIKAS